MEDTNDLDLIEVKEVQEPIAQENKRLMKQWWLRFREYHDGLTREYIQKLWDELPQHEKLLRS